MSSRTRRSSTRPTPTPPAAESSTPPQSATPSAAASTSAAATSLPVPENFQLSSKKIGQLKAAYEQLLNQSLAPQETTEAFRIAIEEIQKGVGVSAQNTALKVIESIRKNCLNEFEVILNEHRLPEKLAEIEQLQARGGVAASSAGDGPTPTPRQAVRNMIHQARVAEKKRLLEILQNLDQENEILKVQLQDVNRENERSRQAVERKQKHVDAIHTALQEVQEK